MRPRLGGARRHAHAGEAPKTRAGAPDRAGDRGERRTQRLFAPARTPHPAPERVHEGLTPEPVARAWPGQTVAGPLAPVSETAANRVRVAPWHPPKPGRIRRIPKPLDTIRSNRLAA